MHRSTWLRRSSLLLAVLTGSILLPAAPALAYFPQTNAGPAASSSGNRTFIAATDLVTGFTLNRWWDLGGSGVWSILPTSGCSSTLSPAVSLVSNGSYVFVLDRCSDGVVRLTQATVSSAMGWTAWASMGINSNLAPAAGSAGNRTVAAVTTTDGRIFYDWWDLGGGGHGFREVPGGGRTNAAPAVAVVNGGAYVFIMVKGTDGQLYLNQGSPGGSFVGWQSMGVATNVAPGAAASGNRTVALVTATDGRILYDWWDLGGGGHGFREMPGGGRTDGNPAGSLVNGGSYLFAVVKGVGSDTPLYLNQGNLGGSFTGWAQI